jgi:Pyruvate/2-oxoacid:ferredoxin oxidoreductase gamma subunit
MLVEFPLAVFKDRTQEVKPYTIDRKDAHPSEIKSLLDIEGGVSGMPRVVNVMEKYGNPEIKIAGFGGQGILLMGAALAQAGMLEDYHVSWLPSYGPEMRGGTANCVVNIKNERIGSPLVQYPTVLIAMNRPSLEKFEPDVVPGGLLIYDSSLIDCEPQREDIKIVAIPATKMADDLGVTRIANMIILGAYIGYSGILNRETLYKSMETAIKRKQFIELNRKAIDTGFEYGQVCRKKNVKSIKN